MNEFEFSRVIGNQPTAWEGHLLYAYKLIQDRKPDVVVELGTHWGHSLFSMVEGANDMGLDTKFWAIDHWEGDEHAGKYDSEVYKAVQVTRELYPDIDIHLWKKTFNQAAKDWAKKATPIDILHIDGRHKYEDVKEDFENWEPFVKDGGLILLHDTQVRNRGFGIYKYWSELHKTHKEWYFDERFNSSGLGILLKGKPSV